MLGNRCCASVCFSMTENVESVDNICGFPVKSKINGQNGKISRNTREKVAECTVLSAEDMSQITKGAVAFVDKIEQKC